MAEVLVTCSGTSETGEGLLIDTGVRNIICRRAIRYNWTRRCWQEWVWVQPVAVPALESWSIEQWSFTSTECLFCCYLSRVTQPGGDFFCMWSSGFGFCVQGHSWHIYSLNFSFSLRADISFATHPGGLKYLLGFVVVVVFPFHLSFLYLKYVANFQLLWSYDYGGTFCSM